MHRTLIVARFDPKNADKVAEVFAESDAGELPALVGVRNRQLFRFHSLYFHLVEAEQDITPDLYKARKHPQFLDVNTKLAQFMQPYDPAWKEPKDAMAESFYYWERDR